MTCEQARERFGRYLYEEMEAAELRRVEAHLTNCPGCRRELETERRFVSALARKMREISEDVSQ